MDNPANPNTVNLGPADIRLAIPTKVTFRPIFATPCRTADNSATTPASSVKNLPSALKLKKIACSYQLWPKLKVYAKIVSQGITSRTHTLPAKMKPSSDLAFPPVEEQRKVARISQAWHAYQLLLASEPVAVTCELAIQDEISHSLCTPLNLAFRMRYSNATTEPEEPQEYVKALWANQKNDWLETAPNVYLPAFTNPVAAMHLDKPKGKDDTSNSKAGFSDKILIWKALLGSSGNRLVFEGKTFWSFGDDHMDSLVSGLTAAPASGLIIARHNSLEMDILTQIWGECHFLDVDFGMITNGSTLRVFIKTGKNQLCFSDVRNWNDDDVFTAMLGLSFIAIDHPKGKNQKIKNYLCDPNNDRKCEWLPVTEDEGEEQGSKSSSSEAPYDSEEDPLYEPESETASDETEEKKPSKKAKARKTQVVAPNDDKKGKGPAERTTKTKAKTVAEPAKAKTVAESAKARTVEKTKTKTPMVDTKAKSTAKTKTTNAPKSAMKAPSNKKPQAGPSTGRHRT